MEDVDRMFLPHRTYKLKPTWTIERIVWIGFLAEVGDGYGSFFGVYVDFISYLILRKFALFS
jgi:hypothetical protein